MKYPNKCFNAPNISGTWSWSANYLYIDGSDDRPRPPHPSLNDPGKITGEVTITQNNLFFYYTSLDGRARIGVFQPNKVYINGKMHYQWSARISNDFDNGKIELTILCNKNNKVTKMYGTESRSGFTYTDNGWNSAQFPVVSAITYVRKCKK